jgi:hypothetical protein
MVSSRAVPDFTEALSGPNQKERQMIVQKSVHGIGQVWIIHRMWSRAARGWDSPGGNVPIGGIRRNAVGCLCSWELAKAFL